MASSWKCLSSSKTCDFNVLGDIEFDNAVSWVIGKLDELVQNQIHLDGSKGTYFCMRSLTQDVLV